MRKKFTWQWTFFFVGLAVMSLGISLTIKGNALGTGPWDVLHIGLFKQFGLTIGTWSILTGLIIVVSTSLFLRRLPKIATWLNMLLIGSFIDLFNWLLPSTSIFIGELCYFIAGFFVMSVGCALYISANVGAGPRDTIMMIIVEQFGGSVRLARTIMEVFAATVGWLLGGPVGMGTVILALGSGQIIQWALPLFRKKLEQLVGESVQ
ncbi:YczE/YyaS/YitT family protein [Bacillus ndiopicus]|uniref:YczE/YyaS/YitT family protein n=1 Tax=Bacillus ndiopicus TaxID=1347368 RepID=UPI0005AB5B4B|nr:membrane protein [Bacillus ndiopicus]